MLTEERFAKILSILERMGSVTVQQLMTELDASESTVRRDLNTLDANGQLVKVHGGAILKKPFLHWINTILRKASGEPTVSACRGDFPHRS